MNSALSPREIQARIRAGASLADVAEEAGVDPASIEGFATPVLAEREFVASSALSSTIRRRGESSHRRLGELIGERLQHRGIDADAIAWDAWRQEDLRWRVVGKLADESGARVAEFVFDNKARFSVADNADARWMIGEQLPDATADEENTVDLDDELALLRATAEKPSLPDAPGDDVPDADAMHDDYEDTSSLDALYDMLSGISEDSVRIYTGFDQPAFADGQAPTVAPDDGGLEKTEPEVAVDAAGGEPGPGEAPTRASGPVEAEPATVAEPEATDSKDAEPKGEEPKVTEPVQDSLVDDVEGEPAPKPKARKRRGRAQVPSWDEIMFGGPSN